MIVGSVALVYRAAQELDWAPKDVVWFPVLVLASWILILFWGFSSHPLLLFREKYLHGKRGFMIAIIIGAAIGAISGAAWWKLALLHQQRMAELESVHAQTGENKKQALRRLRDEGLAISAEFRSLQERMDNDRKLIRERYDKRIFQANDKDINAIIMEQQRESSLSTDHFDNEFLRLRPRAILLRDALKKELPDYVQSESDKDTDRSLHVWFMAGVRPAGNIADYLEKMARSLPTE